MGRSTLLCLALLALPVYGAGDAPLDRATLRGVKTIGVVIDKLDPQLEQEGLTAAVFQHQLEDRLQKAGIVIDPGAKEFLGLRVISIRPAGKKTPYSLCLALGLYQPVTLSRDKDVRTATQTWQVDTLLVALPKGMIQSATDATDRLAAQFAEAWKSVN
ncbi:MAG TPA: hypothetical protein VGH38_02470 [Bryobacteraceae bacterium]|jgi:hypothetical protein